MLKANADAAKPHSYSREDLFRIGDNTLSKVKPAKLAWLVDRDNTDSPLLDKLKFPEESGRKGRGTEERATLEAVDRNDIMGILSAADQQRQQKERREAEQRREGPQGTKLDVDQLFKIANGSQASHSMSG